MTDSQSDQDRKRGRRDLLLAILLLLLGLICLCAVAELAVRPDKTWQVSADMLSRLNPDVGEAQAVRLVPVDERALTPFPTEKIFATAGTPSPVPPVIVGKLPTSTPTQEVAAVPTSAATNTPAPPPTRAPAPTSRPTDVPAPTNTPVPTPPPLPTLTSTPIPPTSVPPTSVPPTSVPPTSIPPTSVSLTDTPTFTPTPTDTPPPTDTPTPTATPTFTPTPTNTPVPPTFTPIPPPTVLSITPNYGYNDVDVDVVITGADFVATPTVYLGPNPLINVTWVDANTINATVPMGLTPGVYALTVTNPDLQSDTLPAAYTVLAPSNPNTTLETGYLMTYGPGASGDDGDDDYVQVIFFEVPTSYGGQLWFRIYDADTGGGGGADTIDELRGGWDTTMTYTLRCGNGAYVPPARSAHPSQGGIDSGPLLDQTAIGPDPAYHDNWGLVFGPHSTSGCELSGSSAIFKLTVQGASGNDGNAYNVILSTDSGSNTAPAGSRAFAYSWTFVYSSINPRPPLYPYVPAGTSTFTQYNWDFDYATGDMTLHTPMQDILVPPSGISGNGALANSSHAVGTWEDGATWTVTMEFTPSIPRNNVTFWAMGDGTDLAIFAHATTSPPP